MNRSLYSPCLASFSSNRIYSRVTRTRSSCAHSTLVYLYGGSIEMSISRRCLLFRIILKSVSSSVDSTSTTFLSYPRHFVQLTILSSLSFVPSFARIPRHSEIRNSKNGNIRICMDARREGERISPLSQAAHLREPLALPRITAVACPVGVISSPEDILASVRSRVER